MIGRSDVSHVVVLYNVVYVLLIFWSTCLVSCSFEENDQWEELKEYLDGRILKVRLTRVKRDNLRSDLRESLLVFK